MDLKRTLLIAFLITLGIMLGGTLINYLYFQSHGYLLFANRMWGGEITRETGFGWVYTHIYSMTPEDRDSISLRFSVPDFILWFLLIFLWFPFRLSLLFQSSPQSELLHQRTPDLYQKSMISGRKRTALPAFSVGARLREEPQL